MKKRLVCCLLFVVSSFVLAQSATGVREEKLQKLKNRDDIKETLVEPNILKLEYPNGIVLHKNIADYKPETENRITYSPTFDSTIIDLTTIDTTLYYQKYKYWQEVPLCNFSFNHVLVGDINNNGKTELYGARKYYETETEPVCIYELNNTNTFEFKDLYDSVIMSKNIYDIDKDGKFEINALKQYIDSVDTNTYNLVNIFPYFKKSTDTSFAKEISFVFEPWRSNNSQQNNNYLGDWDGDEYTDQIFIRDCCPHSLYIFEYNPFTPNFDSVYYYDLSTKDLNFGGFSIGDFDIDGKTEFIAGSINGKVISIDNLGDNSYMQKWEGKVETYNAYLCSQTDDIDGNGKEEIWIGGDAFYNGTPITRITIFETDRDNGYQAVGRIDLVGVFSFYAGNIQAIDIDNDGIDEVAICIDDNFLILKFNGIKDHQKYALNYIKKGEQYHNGEFIIYYGSLMYDLLNNGQFELLISMVHIIEQPGNDLGKFETRIYRPDSANSINEECNFPLQNNLYQNYPNPFNPTTNLNFTIGNSVNTTLKIYNMLGKEITTLLDEYLPVGEHSVRWNGKDSKGNSLPGGVYFIKMIAGSYQRTIKTILLK